MIARLLMLPNAFGVAYLFLMILSCIICLLRLQFAQDI